MKIVMPLFEFSYLGPKGFSFSDKQFSIAEFDPSQDIPTSDLFSKQDIKYMKRASWALVFDHDNLVGYRIKCNLLLLSFRIFSEGKPPYIKYRLCQKDDRKCSRLSSPMAYIHEFEKNSLEYSDADLSLIDHGFVNLTKMDKISNRCHNALYFLFLAYISIHWIESFMFLMNTLEAIFSKDRGGSATQTICTRVSSFLESRDKFKDEDINRLYGIRSGIVHGRIKANEKPLENLNDLYHLQSATIECLKKILSEKIYLKFKEAERDKYLSTLDRSI
jgi:hypothetical protein